jgi:hypothetical protein
LQRALALVLLSVIAVVVGYLMLSQGNEIGGGSPADFASLIKSESAKWSAVVKTANIKPE